jgi:hypothetical protein
VQEDQRHVDLVAQLDELRCLFGRLRKQRAVIAQDADRKAVDEAQPVTRVGPYWGLNSSKREPSTTRAITSRMSKGWRRS